MPTPVMTISDLTENINVSQSENKYHPRFHLKNLPKLAEHGWYLWRHEMEKASKSRLPYSLVYTAHFFSRRGISKVGGAPDIRVQQNPTFIFSVTRSGMLPPFISDAKDAPDIYS